MLKRKKYLDKKLIQYFNWHKNRFNTTLLKSFILNHNIKPIYRLSFIIKKDLYNSSYQYYNSQNKLICPFTFSKKIPYKKINMSRFYLTINTNKLLLGGYQK